MIGRKKGRDGKGNRKKKVGKVRVLFLVSHLVMICLFHSFSWFLVSIPISSGSLYSNHRGKILFVRFLVDSSRRLRSYPRAIFSSHGHFVDAKGEVTQ